MKKKLSLDKLKVESFVTDDRLQGGVPYVTYKCLPNTQYLNCTQQVQVCPWYSELGTACTCQPSELYPCDTNLDCPQEP